MISDLENHIAVAWTIDIRAISLRGKDVGELAKAAVPAARASGTGIYLIQGLCLPVFRC